jgi:hypothetical protein
MRHLDTVFYDAHGDTPHCGVPVTAPGGPESAGGLSGSCVPSLPVPYSLSASVWPSIQVERIREMEVAAARLDEASKARRAMEAERLELDRLHSERLAKLRQREEEMTDKLRRQQVRAPGGGSAGEESRVGRMGLHPGVCSAVYGACPVLAVRKPGWQ